jgi:mycothiol synthase
MAADPPDGHTWRPATLADAEAIFALVTRCNVETIGIADCTLDDIRDELAEPGFDPATDTWLVYSGSDLAGYGWAWRKGTGELVDIDVITSDERLCPWLYDRVLGRAEEMATAGGHASTTVHQGIFRNHPLMRRVAQAHGLAPATAFFRMRVDHDAVVPDPVAPAGVTLRFGPGDERFRRTAHALCTESFKDHFGSVPRTFDEWHAGLENLSTFDWSQLAVAELDGSPVGVLITHDGYVDTDDCGYVSVVGVVPSARGRGIARYLLRTAFAADAKAGRSGTILHVDSNNTTPALGLYERVGMHPIMVIDMWQRSWPLA